MGRTRLASQTIGENAVKTFITIVNAIFQVGALNSETADQKSSRKRERKDREGIRIFSGLKIYLVILVLVKIRENFGKIREIHMFGT